MIATPSRSSRDTGWAISGVLTFEDLVVHLQGKGYAPLGVVKALGPLKCLFGSAVEDGVLSADPTHRLIVNRRDERHDAESERAKAMTRQPLPLRVSALAGKR